MRTLAGASENAIISPVLAQLLYEQNELPSPYRAAFIQQCSIVNFLLGALCLSNGMWLGHLLEFNRTSTWRCLVGSGIMLLLFSCFFCIAWILNSKRANIRFLRDCTQLAQFIHAPGFCGREELKKRAQMRLVHFAYYHLQNERHKGRGDDETELSREKFKNTHATMFRFGLVAPEWDEYFAEAEKSMQPQATPNEQTA